MSNLVHTTHIYLHFDEDHLRRFRRFSLIAGAVMTVLGLAAIALPQYASFVMAVFLGWILLLGAFISGYFVFLGRGHSMIAWLKPVLLFVTALMLLANPVIGVAAMTLLLAFYLLLDAVASLGMAHDYYPIRGWGWLALNGALSLLLAALILAGWPESSKLWLGLFVGLSLLFDGLTLIMMNIVLR